MMNPAKPHSGFPNRAYLIILIAGLWNPAAAAAADDSSIQVSSVFTDHMVLQRNARIPVWGTAESGQKITIELKADDEADKATTSVLATAGSSGKWRAELPPMHEGGPLRMRISPAESASSAASITLSDILVGDVWLCSGQSNMAFTVARSRDAGAVIEKSANPNIRLLNVGRAVSAAPRDTLTSTTGWEVCSPDSVRDFSAVGYFLGRELEAHLDVPVGLIMSAYGGSTVESWISREGLAGFPEFDEPPVNRKKGTRRGDPSTSSPAARPAHRSATMLFNGMIAPLLPFPIKGVAWYQGESNTFRAQQYRRLFPALIVDWRLRWESPKLPFLFVQLPNFHERETEPGEDRWAELREAQLMTLRAYPATGMAVTIDLGDPKDIHPIDKAPVGERLALAARAIAYGEDIEWSGPLFDKAVFDDATVRIKFDYAGSGLTTCDKADLRSFAVAGEDRRFNWADARIDKTDNSVVVTSDKVAHPVAVRYSWAANPDGNLCNREGLRASPFRTDKWPGLSDGLTTDPIPVPRNRPTRRN